jgi:hypothetical protein
MNRRLKIFEPESAVMEEHFLPTGNGDMARELRFLLRSYFNF